MSRVEVSIPRSGWGKLKMPSIDLSAFVPGDLQGFVRSGAKDQEQIPALAKDTKQVEAVKRAARKVPTHHVLFLRDSRRMDVLSVWTPIYIIKSPFVLETGKFVIL